MNWRRLVLLLIVMDIISDALFAVAVATWMVLR